MSIFDELNPPYSTIVADPPWHYDSKVVAYNKTTPMPYSTMSLEEIAALPVGDITARGSHLYLWTTNQYLESAYGIMRSWGFQPSQVLTWCKPTDRLSPGGGTFFGTTEFIIYGQRTIKNSRVVERAGSLIKQARAEAGMTRKELHQAVRGGTLTGLVERWENNACLPSPPDWQRLCEVLPSLAQNERPFVPPSSPTERTRENSTWWLWPRGVHSTKPAAFFDMVERVSPGPYVELFARQPRLGWDHWGHGYETGAA